jgi:hypothetical protein
LKTNNKTDDHSVEVSGGRWKHKRQLVPGGAGGTPLQPAWSTVSSYALGRLPVIPGVERLIILVDHDEAGLTASGTCMDRWIRAGRSVIRLKPKRAGADFNDLVMESAA